MSGRASPEAGDMAWEMANYAMWCTKAGKDVARRMGIPEERIADMRTALRLLDAGDHDAFYAVMSEEYSYPSAFAIADMLRKRAEVEGGCRDDPTDPALDFIIPPEAKP